MIITIDGPTASGKSSTAEAIAKKLRFYYLNSGLLYRALAYILMRYGTYTLDTLQQAHEEHLITFLDPKRFVYSYADAQQAVVYFDGNDITPFLKTPEIDQGASLLGTHPMARTLLNNVQRTIADQYNDMVSDGRDCGSVVFPHADVKFFLTASVEVRAQRWQKYQAQKGVAVTFNNALAHTIERDKRDTERVVGPLRIPADALLIDNSTLTQEQTINVMVDALKAVGVEYR